MTSRFEVNARLRIIPLHTRFWRKLAKLSLQAYRVRSTFQKIAHEIKRNKNHLGFFTYRARKAMSSCFLSRPAASLRQNFGKIEGPSPRQRSVMIAISLIREGFRSLQRGSPRAVHDRSWIREWAQRGRVKSPAEEEREQEAVLYHRIDYQHAEISETVGERGRCRRLFVAVYINSKWGEMRPLCAVRLLVSPTCLVTVFPSDMHANAYTGARR